MRKSFRKSLSLLMALCMMVLSMLPTTAYADLNDTEFHIMGWEDLKDLVREANHVDQSEKLTIHSISVNGTDGTATGGAPEYTNQGDVGAPGTNGRLTGYDNVWTVLNTSVIIDQDSVTSITVYAKIKTGPWGYFGEELPPVTVYLAEGDIRFQKVDGKLITEIYLNNASLDPIPPEEDKDGAVSINLVVDGTPVTPGDADELASYLSSTSSELTVGENGITAAFTYEGEDAWTDLTIVPAEEYVIQGVACDAEGASAEPQGGCQLTGVPDGSTLTLYLRTPYSVAYHVPQGITAPEDSSDYITAEDITEGLWVNLALNTEITLADLDGLDGWYSSPECEGDPCNGPVTVAEDLADGNNIIHFYAKPAVPSAEEIAKALGDSAVVVDCVNADAGHEDGHYGLLGNYTPDTAVINTDGTYTFGITVEPSDYAEQYSAELGLPHYLRGDQPAQRIQLVWGDGRWKMQSAPITVTVECDESGSILNDTEFHIVGLDKIKETVAEKRGLTNTNDVEIYTIYVHGTRNVLGGDGKATGSVVGDYGAATADEGRPGRNGMLIDGTDAWKVLNTFYTINDATVSGITIYAKVNGEEVEVYVPRSEFTITHLTGADSHITQIILEPELPSAPPTDVPDEEELADILGDVIKIHCTNGAAGHEDAVYSLISGSYTPDDNFTESEGKYTFNVTIAPDYYVEQYSAETKATHTLVDVPADTEITLVWNGHEWEVQAPTLPVTYAVVCEDDGSLLNDTEFHIMELEKIKETVAEKRGLPNTNDVEIYTIYVHGTRNVLGSDGTATGGVIGKYFLVPADEGRPGLNGILANGKYDAWKVLNTVDVISDDTVSGITIYAKVNGQEVEVFVPRSELTITHLTGADSHITQIILEPELPSAPPTDVPDEEELADILGDVIKIHCTNDAAGHEDAVYSLISGSYTPDSNFTQDGDKYTFNVTIAPDYYVEQYSAETKATHTLVDVPADTEITLVWNGHEWEVQAPTLPVTYKVVCEDDGSLLNDTEFHIVGLDKIKETVAEKRGLTNTNGIEIYTIYVHGTRNVLGGDGKATGGVIGKYFLVPADEGRPGLNGILANGKYDAWKVLNTVDVISDDTVSGITIYAKVNGQEVEVFVPRSELTITHLTGADSHITQIILGPELPTAPLDPTASDLGAVVNLHCIKNTEHPDHTDLRCNVQNDSFTIGTKQEINDTWTCEVTVEPVQAYLNQYNATYGPHTYADGQSAGKLTMTWDDTANEWTTEDIVTFNVTCEVAPTNTYTLIYDANGGTFTDGAPTYTKDNIPANDQYPLNADKPTRSNYVFLGWSETKQDDIGAGEEIPTIDKIALNDGVYSKTVYAVWGEDENGDGTADALQIVITPADITVYAGGTGYDGVVAKEGGEPAGSTGIPEPGYYFTLPYALNQKLQSEGSGYVNLSNYIRLNDEDDHSRQWVLEFYDTTENSKADQGYIYRLVEVDGENGVSGTPAKLVIRDGNTVITNDALQITDNALYKTYTMSLDGAEVKNHGIVVEIKIGNDWVNVNEHYRETLVEGLILGEGTLTVRGTDSETPTLTTEIRSNEDDVANNDEIANVDTQTTITAVAPNANYTINGSDVSVTNGDIRLFTDGLLPNNELEDHLQKEGLLRETTKVDYQYLDLVDASNGNAYVTTDSDVAIYWKLPANADPKGTFHIVHFSGLDRNYDVSKLSSLIGTSGYGVTVYSIGDDLELVEINGEQYLKFTTSTFSPFALVYDAKDAPQPGDTYTLTYDANALGGTVSGMPTPNPETGLKNGSHNLSSTKPTHSDVDGTDVVFIGWTETPTNKIFSKNDTAPDTITTVTINGDSEIVYAAWGYDVNGNGTPDVEETKYTLTYHANYRGNNGTVEYVYVEGEEVVVKGKLFSRSGYSFDEWNTRANGLGTSYDKGDIFTMPAHDKDLYAQWDLRDDGGDDRDYAVYYHPGYGKDSRKLDDFYEMDETVKVLDNEWFQREDYIFIGWSKTLDDDSPDYLPGDTFKMPSGTVDLYAQWKKVGIGPGDTGVADWLNTDDHIAYLAGYPGNLFGPDNSMTRAEVCQMFYALLENKNVTITKTFNDVPADAWYTTAVNTLATLGMISGYPDGSFRPNDPITRAEFCTIALAFAYEPEDATCSFTDVFVSDWFYPYVAQASTYGWIGGYPNGSFGPREHITRTEVTTIVNRMLGREADRNFVDRNEDELKQFIDLSDNYWGYYQIMEAVNSHEYERSNGVEDWIDLLP